MHILVRALACWLLLAAGGCTTLPKAEKVKAFGDATTESTELLENALRANRLIAVRTSQERQATAYAKGQVFQLVDTEIDEQAVVDAPDQVAALDALSTYGRALALAADQGVVDQLEQASVKLGEAAGSVVVAASPVAAPIVGPALKLSSRVIGLSLGNAYAGEIQAIIVARDPDVQKITAQLILDLGVLNDKIYIQVLNFEAKRQEALKAVRADRRVDRLRLYKEYMNSRIDIDNVLAYQQAIANYKTVLESMAAAHAALAANKPDSAQLVKNFVAISNDLTDLVKVVRAAQFAAAMTQGT